MRRLTLISLLLFMDSLVWAWSAGDDSGGELGNDVFERPGEDETDDACSATQASSGATTQASPEPTKPPEKPICEMQNALPDQFTSAFCRCHTEGGETVTLERLTVENPERDAESCSYTAMPTKTEENPVTEVKPTFTVGCDVCAGAGGVENHDPEWCTPIPGCIPPRPTFALYISDTDVSLGTATSDDDGEELGSELVKKLEDKCPEDEDKCSNDAFKVMEVPIIVERGIEHVLLEATIEQSEYNSTASRDYLIHSTAAGMVSAVRKSCVEVPYEDNASAGESGCGEGPLERRNPIRRRDWMHGNRTISSLDKRLPPTDADGADPIECTYEAEMCSGPRVIHTILGTQADPYLNSIIISFKLVQAENGFSNEVAQFFCEAIVEGLALAAVRYLPKLPGYEAVSDMEDLALEAICGDG